MSDLEQRLLQALYERYKQTNDLNWPTTEAFEALEIENGTNLSTIHDSEYIDIVNESFQITPSGIRYMENLPSPLTKFWELVKKHITGIVVGVVIVILGAYFVSLLGIGEVEVVEPEAYVSTQTVYENKTTTKLEYVDLEGRGQLVPLPFETMKAAMQFGEAKGEDNKIYMHRVVVTALDPSVRYTEGDTLGNTFKPAYDPNKVYTFYIPDGTDITDENASINIIPASNKLYKVKLLSIDGRKDDQSRMSYTFRVEEVTERQ